MRHRKLYRSRKNCINKFLLQQGNVFQTFLLWFCLFFCDFFRSTEVCFFQCISYSRVFRFEHIYKCSTRSLLFGYMIQLNKSCVVEINNSKQKSGARLFTLAVDCWQVIILTFAVHGIKLIHGWNLAKWLKSHIVLFVALLI